MSSVTPLLAHDPSQVGPYRLLGRLAGGGMGVVYLATGPTGDQVALKVMREDLADQPSLRTRFTREVRAARAVAGPYIARLIDADTDASPQWLAVEYVAGPTLVEHVEANGPLPVEQARLLGIDLAHALQAIHTTGLVHRDLKPSNIILSADGPRVIDLGITHDAGATSITQTGDYVGSLAWMSPEQITGAGLSPASDVFAWGLVVAYAALGRHPYGEGRSEAVAYRVVHQPPDLDGLPPVLREPVAAALTADPQQRAALKDLVTQLTVQPEARSVSEPPVAPVVDHATTRPEAAEPPTQPSASDKKVAPHRRRTALVALAAVALAGISGAGAVALDRGLRGASDDTATAAGTDSQESASVAGTVRFERGQTAAVGSKPHGLAISPQGEQLLLADRGASVMGISVVDPDTLEVVSTLEISGEPVGMVVTPNGEQVFTGIAGTSAVRSLPLSPSEYTDIDVASRVSSLAASPDGTYVYAALPDARTIAKIDTRDMRVVDRIRTDSPPSSVSVAPDGSHLIVSSRTTNSASLVHLTDASESQIPVGADPRRVRFSPDGTLAVTANKGDNTVSLIDIESASEIDRIEVGDSPRAAEFTPDGRAILVANYGDASVSVLNVATRSVSQTIPVSATPLGLVVTDSRAYVSHEATGEITVLNRAVVADSHPSESPSTPADRHPSASPSAASEPADDGMWPDLSSASSVSFTNAATPGEASPPGFPTKVSGYQLFYEETVTSRAFEHALTPVLEVPATMNGCANQRHYVRWRALNEDAAIEALWTYPSPQTDEDGYPIDPLIADDGGSAVGGAGWMSSYGCTIPAFRLADLPGASNLSDVVVDFQVWTPAV